MKKLFLLLLLTGCMGTNFVMSPDFNFIPIQTQNYEIATWQKINNKKNNHIHIYIEGDGNAYDAYGQPTSNPTPHGNFVRDMAMRDNFENVVYMARPCQFVIDKNCEISDWTDGRFSQKIINAQNEAINKIAKNKNIIFIGYSGGAMVSGLIIKQNQKLKIDKWITIAGILNHKKWTDYFKDEPLNKSLDMDKLPNIKQKHFVGENDEIVPYELAKTWANEKDIKLIPSATHDDFGDIKIFD